MSIEVIGGSEENYLEEILARKRVELADRKRLIPPDDMEAIAGNANIRRIRPRFSAALETRQTSVALIAEYKRRSPSKGAIRPDAEIEEIALAYRAAQATAISVLTETAHFGGSRAYLARAVQVVPDMPVLMKDFIFDRYQVWEAAMSGASALLLIATVLGVEEMRTLMREADAFGLESLVEVRDKRDLDRALDAGAEIVGVNNRDLTSFSVDISRSEEMAHIIPQSVLKVSESGIATTDDVMRIAAAGYDGMLVGEALMKSPNPEGAARLLTAAATRRRLLPSDSGAKGESLRHLKT